MQGHQDTKMEENKQNGRRNDMAVERRGRKLTRKQVASIIGVSIDALDSYERGKIMPSLRVAFQLQILYRGQIASFYQPLYERLTGEVRAAELRVLKYRGAK